MCVCHLLHVQEYSVLPPVHLSMQGRREDSTTAFSVWQGEGKGLATPPCTSLPPTHSPLHPTHSPTTQRVHAHMPHLGPRSQLLSNPVGPLLAFLGRRCLHSKLATGNSAWAKREGGFRGQQGLGGNERTQQGAWYTTTQMGSLQQRSFAGQTESESSPTFVNRHLAVLLLLPLPPCRRLSFVAFIIFCDGAVWWRRRGGAPAEGWVGWWGRSTAPSKGWISWRRVTIL